jgi:hypothetical protein
MTKIVRRKETIDVDTTVSSQFGHQQKAVTVGAHHHDDLRVRLTGQFNGSPPDGPGLGVRVTSQACQRHGEPPPQAARVTAEFKLN